MSVLHSEAGPSNWHQQQQQQQPPSQHHHHQSIQPLRTDPLRHQPLIPSASPYASSSSPQNGHVQPNSDRRSGGEERNGSSSVRKVDGSSWGVLPPGQSKKIPQVYLGEMGWLEMSWSNWVVKEQKGGQLRKRPRLLAWSLIRPVLLLSYSQQTLLAHIHPSS
jgi:hypothetical protein